MATYGDLVSTIVDDLSRPNLETQVRAAIKSAIRFYEAEPFSWSQQALTYQGVAGDDTMFLVTPTQPLRVRKIRSMRLMQPQLWLLRPTTMEWIEQRQDGTIVGDPTHYAWLGLSEVRFYPTPHRAFTLRVVADTDQKALVADGDSNFWTDEGFDLIRAHAKADVLANTIRGEAGRAEAAACMAQAALHLDRLKAKMARRTPGVLRGDMV